LIPAVQTAGTSPAARRHSFVAFSKRWLSLNF
jgi:hypothetical protein